MIETISRFALGVTFAMSLAFAPVQARELRNGGKLLLTSAITSVDGAGGGGLASWALISGNETETGIGGDASITRVDLPDFVLTSIGAKIGLFDRIELSYAHHSFDTQRAGAALGLGADYVFHQDIFGAKMRVAGDAIFDQQKILPQIAIGVQYKRADRSALIGALGGRSSDGVDVTVSATKLILSQSVLIDATARLTRANQFGLLGFGGDRGGGATVQFEGSAGLMLTRKFIVGGEFRTKPDNLGFAKEDPAFDAFAAYAVHRNMTLSAAYVDLGSIATFRDQRGAFLQLKAGF